MSDRPRSYDAEIEIIETNIDLLAAAIALEGRKRRAYLEHLRKAQAHLTGLIMDAEEHSGTD